MDNGKRSDGRNKRLADLFYHQHRWLSDRNRPPRRKISAQRHNHRKRHQKLRGRAEPNPVAHSSEILSQRKCQQACSDGEHTRLPEMIRQFRAHCAFSFSSLRSAFSASFTSSSVSLPDSISCAITGCVRPPNRPSSSSISLRWAALRETTASKM